MVSVTPSSAGSPPYDLKTESSRNMTASGGKTV
jgi:hypothetical protein